MRIQLVGDHRLLLHGLTKLLQEELAAEIRTAQGLDEADEVARHWRPDVILVETGDVSAVAALLTHLRRTAPDLPLMVIAPSTGEQFLAALRAGARGFIGRQGSVPELLNCLAAVQRGEWGVPRNLTGELVEAYLALVHNEREPDRIDLTERQRRVLQLLAQGMSARQIGLDLYLSESQVRSDIQAVSRTLGVSNRVQAVAEALRLGLVELE